jgi:DHA1 family tetracycline resistance protein-like MFS transporter
MAVIAPLLGAPALAAVTDLSRSDWRMGAPFFLCAALQAVALWLAVLHFRRHPG